MAGGVTTHKPLLGVGGMPSTRFVIEGLLGGNYVELVPGGSPDLLVAGDNIEFTQDSVDIVQLLGRFIFSAEKTGAVGGSSE